MPVMGRITVNGMAVQFSAKVEIKENYWSVKAGKAIGRSVEVQEVNSILDSIKTTMTKIYRDLQEKENNVTPEQIKNRFFGIEPKQKMLLELFSHHNENKKKLVGTSITKPTYLRYELTRSRLARFIKERYNLSDIALREVNYLFVTDFEVFLTTTTTCNANSVAKTMQRFRSIILMAKNNGWILIDPFANYKIRIHKVDRGYLAQEELEAIMQKEFPIKRLEQVRDIFIFSCFTGLAYIDVKNLCEKHIRTSFDGNLWIMKKRHKTDIQSNIPILDIPRKLLEKYKNASSNGVIFPVPSNQKINAYLKEIGDVCGIDKNLTFHVARHTFATTTTLSKGVPIETVSKMLGHTNIRTTQIYARITDNKISHDMAVLAKKLESKKSKLDQLFECLSLRGKMTLFNLPPTLSADGNREKRMSILWQSLSEEEKSSLWEKTFQDKTESVKYKPAVDIEN